MLFTGSLLVKGNMLFKLKQNFSLNGKKKLPNEGNI